MLKKQGEAKGFSPVFCAKYAKKEKRTGDLWKAEDPLYNTVKTNKKIKGKERNTYNMTKRKVLVYGSLNLDYVYQVKHFPGPGETAAAETLHISSGGKGLNQAVAFAKAGAETYLAGKIGTDGQSLRDACEKYGIDTRYLMKEDSPGGHAVIQVDEKGQNSILVFGGTNKMHREEEMDQVLKDFQEGDYLILQNEINGLSYLIDAAWKKNMEIVLNPSPYEPSLMECGLQKLSWMILNEVEACQITGENQPEKVLEYFKEKYPDLKVVLTLGEEGAMCTTGETYCKVPCYKTETVDTTGAGDTFTGYYFAEIIRGRSPKEALDTASKAAAVTVSRKGAADAIPFLKEILDK